MGCLDRIKLYNNQLTKTDMKIVAYFKKHIETIPYLSVEELANKVDVSPAAVIRFIKRLQYNSFAECKIDVAKSDINRALNIENLKFNTSDSIHSLTKNRGHDNGLFQTIDMIKAINLRIPLRVCEKREKSYCSVWGRRAYGDRFAV